MLKICLVCIVICLKVLVCEANCADVDKQKYVVCYYGSWAHYREGLGQYNITHIDPNLCTHIIYTFMGLDINSKITSLDPDYDYAGGALNKFIELKQENPCLKTILAIGGWKEGSRKYSVMASTKESREAFVEGVLRFLVTYEFDGFDFDWEYPTQRGGIQADKANFIELLQLLKARLSPWGIQLSIAVPISDSINQQAYDIPKISQLVDFVSIMAYDYTPTDSPVVGLIAPLSSINSSINYWVNNGLPSNKLVLGMPTYARTYNLLDAKKFKTGSKTNGTGIDGKYTKEPGFLSYYELLSKLESKRYAETKLDSNYYAHYKTEWFSYDKEDTYIEKTQLAMRRQLKGVMVWSIDTDDFKGQYGKSYPVLRTINAVVKKYNSQVKLA